MNTFPVSDLNGQAGLDDPFTFSIEAESIDAIGIYRETYTEAVAFAAAQNLAIFVPKENEIQLDFDTKEAVTYFEDVLFPLFKLKFPVVKVNRTTSKSGNTHVYITLSEGYKLSAAERIAMQAALGSDGKREILSLFYLKCGQEIPSLLFETWEEAKKLTEGLDKQAGV